MRQVGYLQRLYRDARSTEHKTVLVCEGLQEMCESRDTVMNTC